MHRAQAATLRRQLDMEAHNFEGLHWSAKNQGRRLRILKYEIAYGSHG
jgi:hypothetical protein